MDSLRQKIRQASTLPVIKHIICFLEKPFYPAAYALLALLSSLIGLEIAFYGITAIIVVFSCVFSRDSRAIITPVFITVYGLSWKHSPIYGSDFLNSAAVQGYLLALGAIVIAAMVFRVALFNNGRNILKESKHRAGIVLLTLAFLLNGVGFSDYTIANLPFGLLMALSFFLFYVFFFITLDVREDTAEHVAWVMLMAAALIFIQLAKIYIFGDIFENGAVNKDYILTGWGISNNIGGALAMFMPSGFYLALKKRHGWVYYVLSFVIFGGVCLTQSRTAALIAGIVLVAAAIYICIIKSPVRKFAIIFNCAAVAVAVIFIAVFFNFVQDIFATFFERGFDDSHRGELWEYGILNFLRAPIFGVGFYEPITSAELPWYDIENWVFPDMYHNSFIQMLASCGIFGLIAFCVHILQVIFAVRRRPVRESLFYIAVLIIIIGMSQLDNHLFHVFTALVYSVFLLLSERDGEDRPLLLLRPLFVKLVRRIKRKDAEPASSTGSADVLSEDGGSEYCGND